MDKHPLEGIRVIDFAWAWAGAHASAILAFLGAEVIKIESRKRLDLSRFGSITTGEFFEEPDHSPVFNDINLNKLSANINLSHPKGVELVKKLTRISDVVSQNMRPGVMDKLGLGYGILREINPGIIMLSSSARGITGPERHYIGYAPSFAALSGMSYITGYLDGPPVRLMGEIDLMSATAAAFAIIAALVYRQQTGEGQHIDLSSSEAVSVFAGEVLMDYSMNGRVQSRKGNRDDFMAPHNCYRCRGEDKWISIAIATDEEWSRFCEATGHSEWINDERFADAFSRWHHQEELDKLVGNWTQTRTHYEVMELLQKIGIAAMPSFNSEELYKDPHLRERNCWVEVEHPLIGTQTVVAPPWKFSQSKADVRSHGPLLGEHNQYVFGELLGLSSSEIERLAEEAAIY